MFSLICVWINVWENNHEAGDLRRYRAHCGVTVMVCPEYPGFTRRIRKIEHRYLRKKESNNLNPRPFWPKSYCRHPPLSLRPFPRLHALDFRNFLRKYLFLREFGEWCIWTDINAETLDQANLHVSKYQYGNLCHIKRNHVYTMKLIIFLIMSIMDIFISLGIRLRKMFCIKRLCLFLFIFGHWWCIWHIPYVMTFQCSHVWNHKKNGHIRLKSSCQNFYILKVR